MNLVLTILNFGDSNIKFSKELRLMEANLRRFEINRFNKESFPVVNYSYIHINNFTQSTDLIEKNRIVRLIVI